MKKIIYLKTTNKCNLRCKHCYNAKVKLCDMSFDTLVQSCKFIKDYALANSNDTIGVVLHGGEPMMAKIEHINYIIDTLKEIKNIYISVTTNLAYDLNPDLISILFKIANQQMLKFNNGYYHSFSKTKVRIIGSSWDYKIRFANSQQEDLWKKNIRTLLSNDIYVMPGITITNDIIHDIKADDLIKLFKDNKIEYLSLLKLVKIGNGNDLEYVKNKDFDEYMFNAYLSSKKYNIKVLQFVEIEQRIENSKKHNLSFDLMSCSNHCLTIEVDGSVYTCPTISSYGKSFTTVYENDLTLTDKVECNKEMCHRSKCLTCEYFPYCGGGCYLLKWDETCPGMKSIIRYYLEHRDQLHHDDNIV